jgi:competence ComEA-like helix-hairpin-helix protein
MSNRILHAGIAAFLLALTLLPAAATWAETASAKGVVNINTAGVAELALLPRIGSTVAQRIVEFRDANGPFKRPEDLMLVQGIGEKTFALLEPHVALDGKTTLVEKVRVPRQVAAAEGESR